MNKELLNLQPQWNSAGLNRSIHHNWAAVVQIWSPQLWSLSSLVMFNSLEPLIHWPLERSGSNSISAFFKCSLRNGLSGISSETGLSWVPQNTLDDKSILSQAMAWCRQATNHYLVLCWVRSMLPCGVTSYNELTHCSLVTPHGGIDLGPSLPPV